MRYFVPTLVPVARRPGRRRLADKLGGLPWGLATADWPVCSDCGRPQTHLATFLHHHRRLDLGAPGRVLCLFQCEHDPGMCETWSADGGASCALVMDVASLDTGLAEPPAEGVPVGFEALISEWTAAEDDVDVATYAAFFSDEARNQLGDELIESIPDGTKLGGAPCWIQSAEEGPGTGWRFVVQLDSALQFASDPGDMVTSWKDGDGWRVAGPNFGDAGLAYVFVREDDPTRTTMFWQCG